MYFTAKSNTQTDRNINFEDVQINNNLFASIHSYYTTVDKSQQYTNHANKQNAQIKHGGNIPQSKATTRIKQYL
jgi:hypothetical protein